MTKDELRNLIGRYADVEFVDQEIFARRPWIFAEDEAYSAWQASVATELALGPKSIRIVGSAATGFSLSPLKPGRPFRTAPDAFGRTSDIDIALIDPNLFAEAWNTIVSFDRVRGLGKMGEDLKKIRVDVYWGLVAQYSVPRNTNPARKFSTAIMVIGRRPPLRGYVVRCRVYRRIEDLRAYHVSSLRQLRAELTPF